MAPAISKENKVEIIRVPSPRITKIPPTSSRIATGYASQSNIPRLLKKFSVL